MDDILLNPATASSSQHSAVDDKSVVVIENRIGKQYPIDSSDRHPVEIIDKNVASYRNGSDGLSNKTATVITKTRLDVSIFVFDVNAIDTINETFTLKYRMYLAWYIDLHSHNLSHLVEKGNKSGQLLWSI